MQDSKEADILNESTSNISAMLTGLSAKNRLWVLPVFLTETDFGTEFPDFDWILKTNQNAFGLSLSVVPKDEKLDPLLSLTAFFTSDLSFPNFIFEHSVLFFKYLSRAGDFFRIK